MTIAAWPPSFDEALRTYLPQLDVDEPLTPNTDLTVKGLDSLGSVSLLVELEERFEVTIPDEELTNETFATPASLWRVVSSSLASRVQ